MKQIQFFIISIFFCSKAFSQQTQDEGILRYVDPTIGNVAQLLEPTRPTVQLPNQVIRMYPKRKDFLDDQISSFPLTVVSHRLGDVFAMKPHVGEISKQSFEKKMPYDHDLETIKPWFYTNYLLDEQTDISFVPGKKVGIFQFSFPSGKKRSLLFSPYNDGFTSWHFTSENELCATETYNQDIKIYLYATFSEAGISGTLKNDTVYHQKLIEGKNSKCFISFAATTNHKLEIRYAISFISLNQAKENYKKEFTANNFDSLKVSAISAWRQKLEQIEVKGGSEAYKRSFYTALYRCYERPVDITEDGQYYSGYDKKIHQTQTPFFVDDWTWDTYLAHHPLKVILDPATETNVLKSYIKMYEQSGWLPTFPVLFGDHACMNGFHSTIAFLDAFKKGITDFDHQKAFEAMRKNATEATMIPWLNGKKTVLEDFYYQNGFYPALREGEKETVEGIDYYEKRQAVALTLGASYDDWALAQFAKSIGKLSDFNLFTKRANNYKNLWNDKYQMFIPKDSSGKWIEIDPKFDGGMGGRDYYDENNGWTYMWQVQHDIPSLRKLMGGPLLFEQKLDRLFREDLGRSKYEFQAKFPDATALVGQFSMGNEPSFHIPYLFNYTNAPWKTQQKVRFMLDTWFKDNIFGIPGDEDGGGMSAFLVFSSMGFYPSTPGVPSYTIASPIFEEIVIHLPNKKNFTIKAKNASSKNKYIQEAYINNEKLITPWFSHKQLESGATLELILGEKPNKEVFNKID